MGKWIPYLRTNAFRTNEKITFYRCSECGGKHNNLTPYCPWCGEKMEEAEGDEQDDR